MLKTWMVCDGCSQTLEDTTIQFRPHIELGYPLGQPMYADGRPALLPGGERMHFCNFACLKEWAQLNANWKEEKPK